MALEGGEVQSVEETPARTLSLVLRGGGDREQGVESQASGGSGGSGPYPQLCVSLCIEIELCTLWRELGC